MKGSDLKDSVLYRLVAVNTKGVNGLDLCKACIGNIGKIDGTYGAIKFIFDTGCGRGNYLCVLSLWNNYEFEVVTEEIVKELFDGQY